MFTRCVKKFYTILRPFTILLCYLWLFTSCVIILDRYQVRITALEARQQVIENRVRDLMMFTTQTIDENTESDDEFRDNMYKNFKFLNKKIDKIMLAQKQNESKTFIWLS